MASAHLDPETTPHRPEKTHRPSTNGYSEFLVTEPAPAQAENQERRWTRPNQHKRRPLDPLGGPSVQELYREEHVENIISANNGLFAANIITLLVSLVGIGMSIGVLLKAPVVPKPALLPVAAIFTISLCALSLYVPRPSPRSATCWLPARWQFIRLIVLVAGWVVSMTLYLVAKSQEQSYTPPRRRYRRSRWELDTAGELGMFAGLFCGSVHIIVNLTILLAFTCKNNSYFQPSAEALQLAYDRCQHRSIWSYFKDKS